MMADADLLARVDALLQPWREALGPDLEAYRNHCRRVASLCAALAPAGADDVEEKIAIAAAYHDLGLWTDRSLDYLAPSRRLVNAYLAAVGRSAWAEELTATIENHHKLTRYTAHRDWLVEPFRRADAIDVTRGLARFGLAAAKVREVLSRHANAGFHRRLLVLLARRMLTHPLDPLPMLRW